MAEDGSLGILDERLVRVVFAAVATLIGAATILTRSNDALDWSLMAPTVVVFWMWAGFAKFERLFLYMMGLGAPIALNIAESDSEVSIFLVVLTAAIIASMDPNRTLSVVILGVTAVTLFVLGLTGAISEFAWPNWLFGLGFAWGFGELAYRYRNTIDELGETRSLVADQAALQERRRIARDVHDLVGHSLSVVMLHIAGARHLVRKDPDEAERALEQAEAAGRESLAEIRRTVAMLRDDDEASSNPAPSPELADVRNLVNEYLLGGVHIDYDVTGDLSMVDAAAGLAGYRIVQEALTNVTRHTFGACVSVGLDIGAQTYDVAVRNIGGENLSAVTGTGFGLVSMRERAKSVGGLLVAGPTPTGWLVEATLPLHPVEVRL